MSTARIKQDLERYTEAVEALANGEPDKAEAALQMQGLNLTQIRRGCTERLRYAYIAANGYGSRKRIARNLLERAYRALAGQGIVDVLPPPEKKG